jgi:glycosyltransferase involved in cell wall biosynthesis
MIDISVILASKNEEKYIGNTLEKVVEASVEARKQNVNTEIIVIDTSTDNTSKEAKRFTKNVFAFLPKGVSKARNHGASLAKGKILLFMDADTIMQRTSLIDVFNGFRDGTIVSTISRVLPLYRQKPFSHILFYMVDDIYVKLCAYVKVFLKFYNRGDMIAVRKDIFDKINGFDEKLCMLEITDLLRRVSFCGKIKVLLTPVFESGRRLKQWGLLKSYKIWWKNYFSFYVFERLYDSSYEAVR